jgi:hypothetical protein
LCRRLPFACCCWCTAVVHVLVPEACRCLRGAHLQAGHRWARVTISLCGCSIGAVPSCGCGMGPGHGSRHWRWLEMGRIAWDAMRARGARGASGRGSGADVWDRKQYTRCKISDMHCFYFLLFPFLRNMVNVKYHKRDIIDRWKDCTATMVN